MREVFDLLIIGGGVTGAALAYTLSRYRLNIAWLEKENDLAMGASRANTAIVHGGYDPEPDSLMGQLNTEGAYRCMALCQELDVEFKKTGSLVVAFNEDEVQHLEMLYERGIENRCQDLELLDPPEIQTREPHLSKDIIKALWIPHSGVINPWEFTLAMGEVAVRNGVQLFLNHKVTGIERKNDHYRVTCKDGTVQFQSRFVVNAAGTHADEIHNMVAPAAFKIQATRGEYFLLDRAIGPLVNAVIFQCPGPLGKGVLVSPTVHDNILVGPNSEVIPDKEDTSITRTALDYVAKMARRSVPELSTKLSIRNYAGIRANSDYGDFFVQFSAPNFLDLAAIKSPGLTCAPALALHAAKLLEDEGLLLEEKDAWQGGRNLVRFKELDEEARAAFVKEHPLYGRVICRCETITEGEIVAALHREIPPTSLDAIKRRAGTGMGRCQGGFCGPKVLEIIARETGLSPLEITKDGQGSFILTQETKRGETP